MIMKHEEKKKEQSFQTSKITLPLHYYCRQSKKDCVLLALNLLELITRVCDKLVKQTKVMATGLIALSCRWLTQSFHPKSPIRHGSKLKYITKESQQSKQTSILPIALWRSYVSFRTKSKAKPSLSLAAIFFRPFRVMTRQY